jgi:hypothetical protein
MCRLAGRHFLNCIAGPCDFQHAPKAAATDSLSPQVPILKEKLLVAGLWLLQMLAGESLHIVAFASAGTTYRTAIDF